MKLYFLHFCIFLLVVLLAPITSLAKECPEGYSGRKCQKCAENYQDNDGNGSCLPACTIKTCHGNLTCNDNSGEALCLCPGELHRIDILPFCSSGLMESPCSVDDDCQGNLICTNNQCICPNNWHSFTVLPFCAEGLEGNFCETDNDCNTDKDGEKLICKNEKCISPKKETFKNFCLLLIIIVSVISGLCFVVGHYIFKLGFIDIFHRISDADSIISRIFFIIIALNYIIGSLIFILVAIALIIPIIMILPTGVDNKVEKIKRVIIIEEIS